MKYETVTLLAPNIRFSMLMFHLISLTPLSLENGGERRVYFIVSLPELRVAWNF